jgi:hypothetical protein
MFDIDRLKTALADRHAIERELGAGGMATVYPAGGFPCAKAQAWRGTEAAAARLERRSDSGREPSVLQDTSRSAEPRF